ncbi:Cysteine-rich CPCC domain-containing protein, partial [Dysosmobacter welbionis]
EVLLINRSKDVVPLFNFRPHLIGRDKARQEAKAFQSLQIIGVILKVCHLIVQILNLLGSGILGGEEGTILGAGGFNSQFLCAGNIGINFTALFVHNQQGFHIA